VIPDPTARVHRGGLSGGNETKKAFCEGTRVPFHGPCVCSQVVIAVNRDGRSAPSPTLQPAKRHPYAIHLDGEAGMAGNLTSLQGKVGDSEKITINLGYVDLGRVDPLVQEGFYSNRSDFIRTAIRNQLAAQAEVVSRSMVRHTLELGLRDFSRADLEAVRTAGEKLHIKVVGLARIAADVPPELALATIASISVLGALHASAEVKSALAERIC
jgi:Arc/MetJ-type ribon-helix-helix transcriptional regulator